MKNVSFRIFLVSLLSFFASFPALSLVVDAPLADKILEERAKELFVNIRCIVCQGESIADSPAEIAVDMRKEIRKQIHEGRSDEEIIEFFRTQYGDKILMMPPLEASYAYIWFAPFLILLIGILVIYSKSFIARKAP